MNPDNYILFCSTAIHIDITFDKCRGPNLVTMGAHFFHPVFQFMITVATMDFEKKDISSVFMARLFWKLIDKSVSRYLSACPRLGCQDDFFDPAFFVSDGQGSLWVAIRLHFGAKDGTILEGREQSCRYHFGQGVTRVYNCFVTYNLTEYGEQFKSLSYTTIDCEGVDETVEFFGRLLVLLLNNSCLTLRNRLKGFCVEFNMPGYVAKKCNDWLVYWAARIHQVAHCFTRCGEKCNLSETVHASWAKRGGYGLSVGGSFAFDIVASIQVQVSFVNMSLQCGYCCVMFAFLFIVSSKLTYCMTSCSSLYF